MMARTFREGWQQSSVLVKLGLIAVGLIVLAMLAVGGRSWWQNRAYEKREAQREAERQQLETEKTALRAEKDKALLEAADANARADAYKEVAETKRTDRAQTVKELEQIEQQHQEHKAQIEAAGGAMSDDELRRELCARLAARGYKACD